MGRVDLGAALAQWVLSETVALGGLARRARLPLTVSVGVATGQRYVEGLGYRDLSRPTHTGCCHVTWTGNSHRGQRGPRRIYEA